MHLINALAAGVRGAENGSASILKRGLTSRATYYAAFDGTGPVTPSGDVQLDSNGGGVFYVNELCDVICKSSTGTPVRTFTAGDSSPNVEVISQSFTGNDYSTGQSGASKPTTLQAALDKLKTSFGSTDFNVLSGGVATAMSTAVANSITSLFFNVKAAAYGAIGDDATDDTTAIAAAITAASAAGGGTVYFPKGTFRTTATLTVPAGVSFLGSGAGASTIDGQGGAVTVSITGTVAQWSYIRDLAITGSPSITIVDGSVRVDGCTLGSTTAGLIAISVAPAGPGTAPQLLMLACTLKSAGGSVQRSHVSVSNGIAKIIACTFVYPSGSYDLGVSVTGAAEVLGCTFKLGTITSGTATLYNANSAGFGKLVGNTFETPGGSGTPVINAYAAANLNGSQEVGNSWPSSGITFPVSTINGTTPGEGVGLFGRATRCSTQTNNSTPITLPTNSVGTCEVVRTDNAAQTLNFADPPGAGHIFTLVFNNNQAGASGTITIGGTNVRGLASFTAVTANKVSIYTFKSLNIGAPTPKYVWSLTSSDINESP